MQPARNAEARAGENATVALVADVLGADSDDILEEVKTRGSWLSAADAIRRADQGPREPAVRPTAAGGRAIGSSRQGVLPRRGEAALRLLRAAQARARAGDCS